MATQKNNYHELTIEELQSMVAEQRAQLQQMRISHGLKLLEQPSAMKATRREIARMLTAITARSNKSGK